MIKEPKNVDFYTSERQPSAEEFARISQWIETKKKAAKKSRSNQCKKIVLKS